MATEIERKFLTQANTDWAALADSSQQLAQGYLSTNAQAVVRVRIAGEQAFLTIKGKTEGISRAEFEYSVPVVEAKAMLALCQQPIIEKTRYLIPQGSLCWEVDVFAGANQGLVVAEIELVSEAQAFTRPDWLGEEVSGQLRYYNSNLIQQPFNSWD